MILDFGKLRAGVRTLPLRRSCLRELLIRLLPMRPPPRPGDRHDHYCWPSEDEEGGGQNFIGGSYALHDYLSRRDATPPNWAPGDVDFWVPCASHALSIHKPKRVAEELTQARASASALRFTQPTMAQEITARGTTLICAWRRPKLRALSQTLLT